MTIQSETNKSAEKKENNYTEQQIYASILISSAVSSSPLVNIVPVRGTNRELVAAKLPSQELIFSLTIRSQWRLKVEVYSW